MIRNPDIRRVRFRFALALMMMPGPAGVRIFTAPARAETANDKTVTVRQIPDGWTEPEVTTGSANRGASFKPSVPAGFQELRTGAMTGVDSATVHENLHRPKVEYIFRLRLPDGRVLRIRPGDVVTVKKRKLKFLGRKNGAMWFKDLSSGRLLRMVRRASAPKGRGR